MNKPIPTVLRRDSEAVRKLRPLIDDARVLKARFVDEVAVLDDELAELRREAKVAVEEAEENAASIRKQAREQGRKEGLQECMEQLSRARAEYERLRARAEQDMVNLAFQIAHRLIGHTIEVEPEVVRDIVGEALATARGRRDIVVYVHPDDHGQVEAARADYARELDGVPVYFERDSAIERGGCVIETESGRIDARLETQLEVLRDALLGK